MNIKYFKDHVDEAQAITDSGDAMEAGIPPESCFKAVRETMEDLAYRTAVTYTDNGAPSLYYTTTLKGISCYEVGTRDNRVERVSLPSQESRLHG